jgi:RNA polymerase sigma-70 factor (ECF subfamily)
MFTTALAVEASTPSGAVHIGDIASRAMASPEYDALLLRRIADRDSEAFESLYRFYVPRLSRYLVKHFGLSESAEEVCQETLLIVWQQAATFRYQARVSTWIYGIARRQALTARGRLTSQAMVEPSPPEVQANLATPEQLLMCQERDQSVARAVAALPSRHQTVLTMAYYQACSYQEIADHLACSTQKVKVLLQQARRRLSAQIIREKYIPTV